MRATDVLRAATAQLSAITDTPRLDAELLMAHALGRSREALLLSIPAALDDAGAAAFEALLARRLAREPLAYITGKRDFWTISLKVAPGVLIPRPDSETLIEAALAHFGEAGPGRVLDLGTGSGALLLAALAEWPAATGVGIDASDRALDIARENARALGLNARCHFELGDWARGLTDSPETKFELILCNPPYVESGARLSPEVRDHEPASALFAGPEGLDDYRLLIPQLPALLASDGIACIEIGTTQAQAVTAVARSEGLQVLVRQDLGSRDRCLILSGGGRA